MMIKNQKTFNMGMLLAITFFGVLALIFSPVFGGKNGLEYSDELFNKLSKGSSYFIPKIEERAKKFVGNSITVNVKMDKPENVDKAVKMLIDAGAQVGVKDSTLTVTADLGKLAGVILKDADAMYKNNGSVISARYGMDERDVMSVWWTILSKMNFEFQKMKKIEESGLVNETMKKGIEPAFNFYGVEAQDISDKALTVLALLVFYVAYTMWWGYAVFYLFDGFGLSMKKAKVKKET